MIVNVSSPGAAGWLSKALLVFGAAADATDAFLASDNALALVDLDGDDVTGWCWGYLLRRPDGSAMAYLHELEVLPSHRRRGIGTALVREFASFVTGGGATKMFLTTGANNRPARRVYDALGGDLAAQGPTVNYWFALPLT